MEDSWHCNQDFKGREYTMDFPYYSFVLSEIKKIDPLYPEVFSCPRRYSEDNQNTEDTYCIVNYPADIAKGQAFIKSYQTTLGEKIEIYHINGTLKNILLVLRGFSDPDNKLFSSEEEYQNYLILG